MKLISAVLIGAILMGSLGVSLLAKANQPQPDTKYALLLTGSVLSSGGHTLPCSSHELFTSDTPKYISIFCSVRVPPIFAASLPYEFDDSCYVPLCFGVSAKFSKRAPPDAYRPGIFQNTVSKLLI